MLGTVPLEQQQDGLTLGMWVFLASEVMFFGALLLGYTVYRSLYPAIFAEASHHLNALLGTINTAVLLCSSLSMALAVQAAQRGLQRRVVLLLLTTAGLGVVFLGVKAFEYYLDYHDQVMPLFGLPFVYDGASPDKAALFFHLYYIMTAIHAVHLGLGIIVVGIVAFLAQRGKLWRSTRSPSRRLAYTGILSISSGFLSFHCCIW
jgi:cytochrome c oxidase subunit 3